ncbi:MAG TPA: aldose 1-epimerase [Candidatus Dormibacteraeota bacterium]|nr:aldose 1-epimerase [Candidatus Dormibacteraeota bacterium]
MPVPGGRVTLSVLGAEVELEPSAGGRIAALRVDGLELLVTEGSSALDWGCYPMVPWAGRLRAGRLTYDGAIHEFPLTMPPHAIHGTTWDVPWDVVEIEPDEVTLAIPLGLPWPFGGRVIHRVELEPDGLRATLEVHAGERPMPAIVGWHPWFRRRIWDDGDVEIDLPASGMLARGADGLPDGRVVEPPPGPWDDTFVGLVSPPVVRWPGALEIAVRSSTEFWVVYDERETGVCVEPQTGPPNGLETGPFATVAPGEPLVATMTLAWRRLSG